MSAVDGITWKQMTTFTIVTILVMLSEENEQQGQLFLSLGDIETQALSICILKNNVSLQYFLPQFCSDLLSK